MATIDRDLVERELRGDVDARAACERDLERWRDVLVAMTQDIDAQFSARSAAALEFQNECTARGGDGKHDWFVYSAEHQAWRRSAVHFKRFAVERLRDVKALIKERNVARDPGWRAEAWADVRSAVDAWDDGLESEQAMRRIEAALRRYDDRIDASRG